MADKYWYITGSTANWSTANWWTESGGMGTSSSLAATDDAILDANSGTGSLSISAAATCNSLDATTYSGSLTGSAALNIVTNTTPLAQTALAWGAAMTQSYTGTTTFSGTDLNSRYIFCNGQSFKGNVVLTINPGTGLVLGDTFRTLPTNTLTITAGEILASDIYCGTFSQTGTTTKTFNCDNLYLTGITPIGTFTGTAFTSTIPSIYVTNTSVSTKTVTFTNSFGSTNLYFSGSGPMVLVPGTSFKPSVYVDSVGTAASSFNISTAGTLASLTFQPNTAVTWSNAAVVVTLEGSLTLTSSMAVTATPSLTFSSTANATFSGKSLTAGTLVTVNNGSTLNFLDDYDNLGATTITNTSVINAAGFKTAGVLTVTNSILKIPGIGFASGSGGLTAPAVDGQTYQGYGRILLRASKTPVPTATYTYNEFYFLTGSTATQTAAKLAAVSSVNPSLISTE